MKEYVERFYRDWCSKGDDKKVYTVKYRESDLLIKSDEDYSEFVLNILKEFHEEIMSYSLVDPYFLNALKYYEMNIPKPHIVSLMFSAAKEFNIGPMAAVAGAFSQLIGEKLSEKSSTVIIENGGDLFIKSNSPITVGIFAGESPFSGKIGIKVDQTLHGYIGVCTSSGTVGPSKSFGVADAAIVVAKDAAFADAGATALGNLVQKDTNIKELLKKFIIQHNLIGGMIIRGKELAAYGVQIVKTNS
ncbi:MAG: uncharacterized protein PWQ20_1763 [Thermotogaceae bacterium]|jgi:hypothetical protein|nr:uncharacterized protein [Thermotogaceae bacterium]